MAERFSDAPSNELPFTKKLNIASTEVICRLFDRTHLPERVARQYLAAMKQIGLLLLVQVWHANTM